MKKIANLSKYNSKGIDKERLLRYTKLRSILQQDVSSTEEYYFAVAEDAITNYSKYTLYDYDVPEKILISPGGTTMTVTKESTIPSVVALGNYSVICHEEHLKNMPVYVGGTFSLFDSDNIIDLTGIPQYSAEGYVVQNCSFKSFKGLPEVIEGNLTVQYCRDIDDLDYFPKEVKGRIMILYCPLFRFNKVSISKICKCSNIISDYNTAREYNALYGEGRL